MIPEFIDIKGPWKVLPPGVHTATLREVEERFATNAERTRLFRGFKEGLGSLRRAGCKAVFLDGSFVTTKPVPGDFDVCWDPTGVDHKMLDPVLLDFSDARRNQKLKYGGEFFPSSARADGSQTFVDFFQTDRETGQAKGIIRVRISGR